MTLKENVLRKLTQSVDIVVRNYVMARKIGERESFNSVLRRLFNLNGESE